MFFINHVENKVEIELNNSRPFETKITSPYDNKMSCRELD